MHATPLEPLSKLFGTNDWVLGELAKDLSADDWLVRHGSASHALWILGHVALCRRVLLRDLGEELAEEAWESLFQMKTEPGDGSDTPAFSALIADFNDTGKLLCEKLASVAPEEAAREIPGFSPGETTTIGDKAGFWLWHESYHMGQMSLIRRSLGKTAFI